MPEEGRRHFGRCEIVEEEAAGFRKQLENNEKGGQDSRKQMKNQQIIH